MLLRDSIEVTRTGFEEEGDGGREQDTRTMVADGDLNCFDSLYTRVAKETTGLSRPKRITTTTTAGAANANDETTTTTTTTKAKTTLPLFNRFQ